ncbi:MAG: hypothetical protein JW881_00185 [Spirochaetales bacterium]|nr:hypothetical protein [Spirochaetales bacterium]
MSTLGMYLSGNRFKNALSSLSGFMTKERIIIVSLFLAALLLRLVYFSHTDPFTRTDDAPGHFEYIEFIEENMALPAINELEQSYHPPLYYVIASVFRKILMISDFDNGAINRVLQFLSLCFNMGFLVAGTLVLKRYISDRKVLFLCIALLYFWPSSILHAARIGNDNLLYCCYGFGFFFLCKWYDDGNKTDLSFFTLFALLGLFTKANGIVILGCFGVLLFVRFFRTKAKRKFVLTVLPYIIILLLAVTGLFIFSVVDALNGYEVVTFANRMNTMGWGDYIGINANNFLYFDAKTFLNEPFTDLADDRGGRQYFFNYLFKTSLFGEFSANTGFLKNCATIMSFLLLVILLIMAAGIVTSRLRDAKARLPILLNLILFILASAVYRLLSPIPCSNDFRYIFPAVISLPVLVSGAISYMNRKKMSIFGYSVIGVIIAFTGFSIVFYLLW